MFPKLSVIITTYNRASSLKNIISDVLAQDMDCFELIICDDGSSDNTSSVVDCFCDDRIIYKRNNTNIGFVSNLKKSLQVAKGEHIVFLADDDRLGDGSFFKKAVNCLESDSDIGFVFGKVEVVNGLDTYVKEYDFKAEYSGDDFCADWCNIRHYYSMSAMVFRKSILIRSEAFESLFSNASTIDQSTVFKAALCSKKIVFIDMVAYRWKVADSTSLSGSGWDDLARQCMNFLAFPIDVYMYLKPEKRDLFKDRLNDFVSYGLFGALSYNYAASNKANFEKAVTVIKEQDYSKLWVYGGGETSQSFRKFAHGAGLAIEGFIDDFAVGAVRYTDFLETRDGFELVLICTYKHNNAYQILKKLILHKVRCLDLFDSEIV